MERKTRCVQGAGRPAEIGAPIAPVIVPGCTFDFGDQGDVDRFYEEGRGYLYSRYDNPTVAQAAREIAALEETEAAAMFASGMAAISTAVLTLARPGRRILAQRDIYGGTTELFRNALPEWGFAVETVGRDELAALDGARLRDVSLIYLESPTNPMLRLVDLAAIAEVARRAGVPTLVDSTFASPMLQRPATSGIDLVMHSATKYLGGHSDLMGGVICGSEELVGRIAARRRLLGGVMDSFSAYLLMRGLRTLAVRQAAQQASAGEIAGFLDGHPKVETVTYPGLPGHPDHDLASRQMDGFGAMVSFCIAGGVEAARACHDRLRVFRRSGSLGSVESLISIPALMSHRHLPRAELEASGVPDGLVRLSIGLESSADLVADLDRALS